MLNYYAIKWILIMRENNLLLRSNHLEKELQKCYSNELLLENSQNSRRQVKIDKICISLRKVNNVSIRKSIILWEIIIKNNLLS